MSLVLFFCSNSCSKCCKPLCKSRDSSERGWNPAKVPIWDTYPSGTRLWGSGQWFPFWQAYVWVVFFTDMTHIETLDGCRSLSELTPPCSPSVWAKGCVVPLVTGWHYHTFLTSWLLLFVYWKLCSTPPMKGYDPKMCWVLVGDFYLVGSCFKTDTVQHWSHIKKNAVLLC